MSEDLHFLTPSMFSANSAVSLQFSRKDHGIYKAVLADDRGKDTSVFDISGQGTFLLSTFHQSLYI